MVRERYPIDRITCPDCLGEGILLYANPPLLCFRCKGWGTIENETVICFRFEDGEEFVVGTYIDETAGKGEER